jgi:SAM-dependent methyltransferase
MEWFEDDSFWRELYPYMFTAERFAAAPEEADQILALTNFQERAILDLACGPGRHSVEFARRGYLVTGVDRTAFLIDVGKKRAAEAGVNVEWIESDMREFVRPKSFDLALSMFTSLGYFGTQEEELRVLRNVQESLRPGGTLLVEMAAKERLAQIWTGGSRQSFPDGAMLFEHREVYDDWSRIRQEWTLVKDGRARTFPFTHSIFSGRELKTELLAAGFGKVHLLGDLLGKPFGLGALRLVALATKTG